MQKFSIHSHSDFTDGWSTLEDMIVTAKDKGLELYGVSDHFVVHPKLNIHHECVKNSFDGLLDLYEKHFENIRNLGKKYDFNVKCGLEVDYINQDEWIKDFSEFNRQLSSDYLISGTHCLYNDDFSEIINVSDPLINDFSLINIDNMMKNYWKNIKAAIESGYFDMVAHLDYPKKLSCININNHQDLQEDVINTLIKKNIPIEINTNVYKSISVYSPGDGILDKLISVNHPICISDDSHTKKNICSGFNEAYEHLTSLGHTNWWKPNF